MTTNTALLAAALVLSFTASAIAETRYPTPTRDGKERIKRTGACPTGYFASGDKCEAFHKDTPRAYPYIPGTSCPSGTFRSGDVCKAFR